ncbi:MAG: bifunctional diaminohydroxyphosphoribosylaminopyrimidine deaminase/5-amino-6-(5-phosphoribosylamino)uracil reductase RibD, partial [Candidatus Altiarchaeales archaeon]|nr:bifunctional diaminohydroxyphosphoribosylaminopyrimidine deaminase/5-amino-6-(5-phosphoribosylamino)uracil reductase RibD [Candidatus Altiarchaeales archaeon]
MIDEKHMLRALELSLKGSPSPNPYVGAVLVKGERILGEGFHRKAGCPHAEVEALNSAGDCRGATLYVSLEPCSHEGRTPACTDAIINAGVSRVVYAADDPTPKVRGREELLEAGVEVLGGVLEGRARKINEVFYHNTITGKPFVVLKAALTLDGKIATEAGESKWITTRKSREYAHKLR